MRALLVFVSSFVTSGLWARWAIDTASRNAFASTLADAAIIATGALLVDAYVRSRWYVVPAVVGCLGNYLAVRRA